MGSSTLATPQSLLPPRVAAGEGGISPAVHRWNFWVSGSESAIFTTANDMMGPMTLIPFLFAQTGIHPAWIGLFTVSALLTALGSPFGAAAAGRRQWKLPFCVRVGFVQRLFYVAVPLGAMFLFESPGLLLVLLVASWTLSNFVGGIGAPVFQFMITNGTWESWWGRMMSFRSILAACGGLGATGFVWWVNRAFEAPRNYAIVGWVGVGMLFLSLFLVSRFREVPIEAHRSRETEPLADALRHMGRILRQDARLRWLAAAHIWRSSGFILGAYMTALLVERCSLSNRDMWIPVLLSTLPAIGAHALCGWLVDRWGAQRALALSAALTAVNSIYVMFCFSLPAFVLLFISGNFAGSLMMNGWPTLVMKLAPRQDRPAYFSALSLATAPGNLLIMAVGILLVRVTGYHHVFYVSAAGGLLAAWTFWHRIPNIRHAPAE